MQQISRQEHGGPVVSILIPTFNRAGYLQAALASACAQTYPNLEIIVLDDASSDNTPAVVRAFQQQDDRIVYVRNHRNRGLVANWRQGVEMARGDFFCFLGDDDTLEPAFVETLLQPLRQDARLVLAFCDHWVMDGEGRRLPDDSERNTRRWRRARLPEGSVDDFLRVALIDRSVFIGAVLFRRASVHPTFLADEARAMVDLCCCTGARSRAAPTTCRSGWPVAAGNLAASAGAGTGASTDSRASCSATGTFCRIRRWRRTDRFSKPGWPMR